MTVTAADHLQLNRKPCLAGTVHQCRQLAQAGDRLAGGRVGSQQAEQPAHLHQPLAGHGPQ